MKKLSVVLLSFIFAVIIGVIVDSNIETTTNFTFDKEVKYVIKGTNHVAYYAIIGENGEVFYVDKDDIGRWKDKRLYKGREYAITTNGIVSPKVQTIHRLKNVNK